MNFKNSFLFFILFFSLINCQSILSQSNKKFTIILDAGHGGKDPGNSYHGYSEKDIALKTTLKVGEILENEKDFNVIYTRTTDVFIELANRPKIANKADANLFVSIHCNSVNNYGPSGTETFVMGLSRSDMNLEVAKSENSVIYLEDNYKETYKGFNPKKPESLLGITMMQEEYLKSSINLASKIEDNFTNNLKRKSRGVKQQPLWVLDASYMPSILIELGFLSNKEEGAFLNSIVGQNKMAEQIADAIIKYKKEYFGDLDISKNKTETILVESKPVEKEEIKSNVVNNEIIFKVQLLASSKKISTNSAAFKGMKNVNRTFEKKLYRYFYGATSNYNEIKKLQLEAKKSGFTSAFIIALKNGNNISLSEALKQI
jgi:N-acetylmuramoyl-L-alanine amidase